MPKIAFLLVFSSIIFFACTPSGPKTQMGFYNDSGRVLNIVIEDEEFNYYDEFLKPQSTSFYYSDTGTFDLIVYEEDGSFYREVKNFRISETEGSCNYLWVDLAAEFPAVVVNFNSLYEEGGFYAQSVRQYQSTELIYQAIENTEQPFIPGIYYQCEFVNPFEPIPSSIDVGDNVYGIVPLDQHYDNLEDLYTYLSEYIEKYN